MYFHYVEIATIVLTVHFQFTEFVVSVLGEIVWIRYIMSTFVVVNDVTSVNLTVDSLVL